MPNKPFTIRLTEEARENLKFLSTSKRKPQASIASEILSHEIEIQASRTKSIQEALEEARQGAFVSQEAMEMWVDSLGTEDELPMPKADVFHNSN